MEGEILPLEDEREQYGNGLLSGDREVLDQIFTAAYEELRRLASAVRRRDPSATLSPTTLVNEAWMKLMKTPAVARLSPLHFRRIAARAMRQVLIAAARRRSAGKRGDGPAMRVTLDESMPDVASRDEELLILDAALNALAKLSPRQAAIVEARFFGGLEGGEIASLLGLSESTVLRDWRVARAWLARQISGHAARGERVDGR